MKLTVKPKTEPQPIQTPNPNPKNAYRKIWNSLVSFKLSKYEVRRATDMGHMTFPFVFDDGELEFKAKFVKYDLKV